MGAGTGASRDPRKVLDTVSTVLEDGTVVSVETALDPSDPLADAEPVTLRVEVWNLAARGRQTMTVTPAVALALAMRLREALGALGRDDATTTTTGKGARKA